MKILQSIGIAAGPSLDIGRVYENKQLKDSGTLACLSTTFPPESPVAWSSFLCGCNPGRHNILNSLGAISLAHNLDVDFPLKVHLMQERQSG